MSDYLPLDLLGDPVPEGKDEPGRPPHTATQERRQTVIILLAQNYKDGDIAAALGITVPTLKKHYKAELAVRSKARMRMYAALSHALFSAAMERNTAALKECLERLERAGVKANSEAMEARQKRAEKAPEKKGKKAEAQAAAEGYEGLYAPPAPPSKAMH